MFRTRFTENILITILIFTFQYANCDVITIVACDTHANNLQTAVRNDLVNIRNEAAKIALYTKLDLKELIFDGDTMEPKTFLSTLRSLKFAKDDIVFFYFSGHGYRTYSKEEANFWPDLFFTKAGEGVDYSQVLQILSSKNPKFLLAIADCCNNYLDDLTAPPVIKQALKPNTTALEKNYKKLFLEMKGSILIASSSVSEYSWSYPKGAVFTLAFIQSLTEETTRKSDPKWQVILNKTTQRIKRHQTPIYLINTF